MGIVDLTSMTKPLKEQQIKIEAMLSNLSEDLPSYCFQCAKCTSGCEAMKLLELEPHRIMALCKMGFSEELVNSDIIWTCITCQKCKERCPQKLAPIEVLFALKNLAMAAGKQVPGDYTSILQSVIGTGLIQSAKEVGTRDLKGATRESLGLPPLPKPKDQTKFQQVLMKAAMETLE